MVGAEPPQVPKPPTLSTATALHVAVGLSTTFPLMCVIGTERVLVTPVVAAMANGASAPRIPGAGAAAATAAVLKLHTKSQPIGVPAALVTVRRIVAV